MGSKRHPLDVFRSTDEGFVSASQQKSRRKITGKVLTSASRPQPPSVRAVPSSTPKVTGGASLPRLSPGAFELLRKSGLAVACVAVVGLAVWSLAIVFDGPVGDPLPLSKESTQDVLGSGWLDGSAPTLFTIQASQYPGTAQAQAIAWDARNRLVERGFPDVLLLAWPAEDGPEGAIDKYVLVVGAAPTREDLAGLLAQLQAISDWPGGKPSPFTTALVVQHPSPEQVESQR